MRRTSKITNLSIIFLAFAGIFNLLSFALDQQVVQQEDKIREINRKVNTYRNEIESLIFGINTLEDLGFNVYNSSATFLDDLDFQTKAVQIFNSKYLDESGHLIRRKFTPKQNNYLNKVYKSQLFKLKEYSNKKILDVNQLFVNTFSSGIIYDYLKEKEEYNNLINLNKIQIPDDIFENYNFDEKPSELKEDNNYKIYNELYDLLSNFSDLNIDLMVLNEELRPVYVKKYSDYVLYLEFFSERKNIKNFFILFSISCQILGLTFLLMLFRNIIKENN